MCNQLTPLPFSVMGNRPPVKVIRLCSFSADITVNSQMLSVSLSLHRSSWARAFGCPLTIANNIAAPQNMKKATECRQQKTFILGGTQAAFSFYVDISAAVCNSYITRYFLWLLRSGAKRLWLYIYRHEPCRQGSCIRLVEYKLAVHCVSKKRHWRCTL